MRPSAPARLGFAAAGLRAAPLWACGAFVLASLAWLSARSFDFYFSADDYHNLRWALEYRDEPWRALTERHAMHDHIRPLTLLTSWAALAVGDAEPWILRGTLVALHLAGFAAVVELARRRGGGLQDAVVAGLFVTALPGFQFIFSWLAWLCSAGEMAAGLWALVAADRALRAGRSPWAAVPLVVVAGLFKEPGWVVWPIGIAAMAWERRGAGGLADRAVLGALGAGAAGFAWSWHAANLSRAMGGGESRLASYLAYVSSEPARLLDGWPAWSGTWASNGPGVHVVVALPLLVLLAARRADARVAAVAAGSAIVGLLGPAAASLACLALLAAVAVRGWREHLVELLVFGTTFAALATSDNHNEVQTLACGYALAVLLARGARIASSGTRVSAGLLAAGLALVAARASTRTLVPTHPMFAEANVLERAAHEGLGSLAQALGARTVVRAPGPPLNYTEVLEAFGLTFQVVDGASRLGALVSVNGGLLLPATAETLEATLYQRGALAEVPVVQGQDAVRAGGLVVQERAGLFALGLYTARARAVAEGTTLAAVDGCGTAWVVRPADAGSPPYTVVTGYLPARCAPLRAAFTVPQRGRTASRPFFVRLRDPRSGLWVAADVPRTLDVRPETVAYQPGDPR